MQTKHISIESLKQNASDSAGTWLHYVTRSDQITTYVMNTLILSDTITGWSLAGIEGMELYMIMMGIHSLISYLGPAKSREK